MVMDNRGQISAELIIVIAAMLAVAILLVSQLTTTTKGASESLSKKSEDLLKQIDQIGT